MPVLLVAVIISHADRRSYQNLIIIILFLQTLNYKFPEKLTKGRRRKTMSGIHFVSLRLIIVVVVCAARKVYGQDRPRFLSRA